MRDQRNSTLLEMPHHAVETGIIQHDELAFRIFLDHADVFPHLHGKCTTGDLAIDAPVGIFGPVLPFEALHGKRGGEVKAVWIGREHLMRNLRLPFQGRKIRVIDVDRENFEPVLLRNLQENAVVRVHVHMGIEFRHSDKVGEGVRGAGLRNAREQHYEAPHCGDQPHQDLASTRLAP